MPFRHILHPFFLLFACMLFSKEANAQSAFSYVYIQGDKQTPFYVKLEDEMQPRYGKNYSIISKLAPGAINVEILFQQNIYPPQKFVIRVPENGYRGFILSQKGNNFSLYDIQQRFYLPSGNSLEDDHVPEIDPTKNFVTTNTPEPGKPVEEPIKKPKTKKVTTQKVETPQEQNGQPQFIENIELNSDKTIQNANEEKTVEKSTDVTPDTTATTDTAPVVKNTTPIANSDCPKPVGTNAFTDLYNKAQDKSDKNRLKFLLSKLDYCYTSNQVRILTKLLNGDPERFEFMKQAYHRVTDQSNFQALSALLSTKEWQDQFSQILQ